MTDRPFLFEPFPDLVPELDAPPEAAELEPEPLPAELLDPGEEDIRRGYRVTRWAGRRNFECILAPFASLDEAEVQAFVARMRAKR